MGITHSECVDGKKKHGIKQGTVLTTEQTQNLARQNVKLPKFIENKNGAPTNMTMERIAIPYEPHKDKWCVLIRNAFTKKECQELISLSEKDYGTERNINYIYNILRI